MKRKFMFEFEDGRVVEFEADSLDDAIKQRADKYGDTPWTIADGNGPRTPTGRVRYEHQ